MAKDFIGRFLGAAERADKRARHKLRDEEERRYGSVRERAHDRFARRFERR